MDAFGAVFDSFSCFKQVVRESITRRPQLYHDYCPALYSRKFPLLCLPDRPGRGLPGSVPCRGVGGGRNAGSETD